MKSEGEKDRQKLVQLDGSLAVLQRVHESFGHSGKVRQFALAQAQVPPTQPNGACQGIAHRPAPKLRHAISCPTTRTYVRVVGKLGQKTGAHQQNPHERAGSRIGFEVSDATPPKAARKAPTQPWLLCFDARAAYRSPSKAGSPPDRMELPDKYRP
ncbi:hypothetical protein AAFH96_08025 [Polymorphospora sp. 2-325]|uniref:Uncharacterized protein n=1 Tax=Polymorphospora lycopeni TaxID=3140240 RepID=A0ABV5CM32_9ACTN